jgi:hypothetical protein
MSQVDDPETGQGLRASVAGSFSGPLFSFSHDAG